MNVTVTLDDNLVKTARKIAVERDTTLTGLIRESLEQIVADSTQAERQARAIEALRRGFDKVRVDFEERNWTRADLHERR